MPRGTPNKPAKGNFDRAILAREMAKKLFVWRLWVYISLRNIIKFSARRIWLKFGRLVGYGYISRHVPQNFEFRFLSRVITECLKSPVLKKFKTLRSITMGFTEPIEVKVCQCVRTVPLYETPGGLVDLF